MSYFPAEDPACSSCESTRSIKTIIDARARAIDGFTVGRVLPSMKNRAVGPFVFFDHMGPADLPAGHGIDVRPHPHIHLATVTYLFEGEIVHRDSLGSEQTIRPGAINWMSAGRGIVHSERTPPPLRESGSRLHGIQLWVALPKAAEESDPTFRHHEADTLPSTIVGDVELRVLAGSAYGVTSPVETLGSLFYVEATMPEGSRLDLPDEEERAVYVVDGTIACGAEHASAGRMFVFEKGTAPVLRAESRAHVLLIGGPTLDGPRHIWWNFVSSSKERIERAKEDWRAGRFPTIPGDDEERIPLPEGG
ncbi:MAG: pirin family protein [Polyangiaceae bacterium]|nr:pirin family protein [Polyangiaceae bacterium]